MGLWRWWHVLEAAAFWKTGLRGEGVTLRASGGEGRFDPHSPHKGVWMN